jgi:hypothetical protein
MDYQWVKTERGWRLFWGIDPLATRPGTDRGEAAPASEPVSCERASVEPSREEEALC